MQPYEEYADKVLSTLYTHQYVTKEGDEIVLSEPVIGCQTVKEIRTMLMDAWIAGISYSLDLIAEAERSPFKPPYKPFHSGDKIAETFIYCQEDK